MSQDQPTALQFAISSFNETYFPTINREQFTQKKSTEYYDTEYKKLTDTDQLHIIVGMDSGLLANYVMSHPLPAGSHYLFVELDEVLDALNIDIEPAYASAMDIISFNQLAQILTQPQYELFFLKNRYQLYLSLGAKHAYTQNYRLLKQQVQLEVEQAAFNLQANINGDSFIQQQLFNACDNIYPAELLRHLTLGADCLVIGGGPSLDKHIDWVKQHQDELIIISVSRAAEQLHHAGIHIDFVVTVDPQQVSFATSKAILNLPLETILINADHAHPALLGQWQGSHFYTGQQLPWRTENNMGITGPTVSNSAVQLAATLGAGRILLLGVDMCWSPTGVSHASGSLEGRLGPFISKIGIWVPTNNAQQAETTVQLSAAITSLEQQIKALPDTDVISLSLHGAKIKGVAFIEPTALKLASLPDKYELLGKLRQRYPAAISGKHHGRHLHQLAQHCRDCQKALQTIFTQAQIALDLSDDAVGHADALARLQQQLDQQFPAQLKLIKFYGYHQFSKFLSTRESDTWQQNQVCNMSRQYYQAMSESCHSLINLLDETLRQITSRQEENRPYPNLSLLAKQWQRHQQSGRIDILLQRHPTLATSLTFGEAQIISRLLQAYRQTMQVPVMTRNNRPLKQWDLLAAEEKLEYLHLIGHTQGLAQMVAAFAALPPSDKAKQLGFRAKSYLYQLEGKDFESHQAIHSMPQHLQQEADIRQQVLISLKTAQVDTATTALEALLPYSDEYAPQLAKLYTLQQRLDDAINCWQQYLQKVPCDSQGWTKLADILLQQGHYQQAKEMYQQAVEVNPDNLLAARQLTQLEQALARSS
ncbi:hypothetical protein NFHSH190041_11780 [Shewanella sp. NFH-SH190041]|uniref:6-hydroxymethylpterin diphosphokinase MptE-like protein n=1 Tax=Shewanella sp. NFH-SH190041 TaxID=2950245 RepID=UPI0021C3BFF4|nr:6-hydroxymethylpterin diphosphokinase MptE-like protein [Shewanella sp. NFH-SH190041]BDM63726.1 hypothetical protein NFHSH190041_11780 [Shewanella sp. NFH-SH190041]